MEKEAILEKAKKVLYDLNPKYFKEENISNVRFSEENELSRGPMEGTLKPCWIISIIEPVFDNLEFLTFSDEGEPLYIQKKYAVLEIEKSSDGKYIYKN